MSSLPAVETALYSALSGNSGVTTAVGTRLYNPQAPAGTVLPYVLFYLASGLMPNQSPRLDIHHVYRVEAVGRTRAQAEAAFNAVFAALHLKTLTVTGWSNHWTACERVVSLVDNLEGVQFHRRIGDFRIMAAES